jgi:DHA2 family multidrug resistance protein
MSEAKQPGAAPAWMGDQHAPLKGATLLLLTAAVAMAAFMEILDMTIVNVSVPSISGSLGVSNSEGTWAISSYMLAAAVMQPLTGWIGRRFGEVRTLVTSICLFMAFSAVCGLATSMPMLVLARLTQGLVSGPMVSVAQATLLRNYPAERRGVAIGLWAMVIVIAPIFGPIIGGWITDNLSWPWLFYINIPVGTFSAVTIYSLLRRRETKKVKAPIDIVGLVLLIIGVGCLQFVLDNGNDKDWFNSNAIVIASVTSFVALSFWLPWELTDKHPVVDLHSVRKTQFRVGTFVIAIAFFGISASNVVFPLWLQTTAGYTATWAGLQWRPSDCSPRYGADCRAQHAALELARGRKLRVLCFRRRRVLDLDAERSGELQSIRHAALLSGTWVDLLLPADQRHFVIRNLAKRASLGIGLEQLRADHVGKYFNRGHGVDLESPHGLSSRRVDRACTHGRRGLDAVPGRSESHGITGTNALQYVDVIIGRQAETLAVNDVFVVLAWGFVLLVPFVWFAKPPFAGSRPGAAH